MRSLFLVSTGDQSISSCEGGGSSVIMRGCGLIGLAVGKFCGVDAGPPAIID